MGEQDLQQEAEGLKLRGWSDVQIKAFQDPAVIEAADRARALDEIDIISVRFPKAIAALKEIYNQGCVDPLAHDSFKPELLEKHPDIMRCAKYSVAPDWVLCPACIAEQALKDIGQFFDLKP
jgi:hypothetical protein